MSKVDGHGADLRRLDGLDAWIAYLAANSNLPGPRGNLELVAACGEEADMRRAEELVATDDEFATVCGAVALGRHFGLGDSNHVGVLRRCAADERWRVREGAAMAVQRAAADDPERAFALAEKWAVDSDALVRRAAIAGVCEPRLLVDPAFARRALAVVEGVTHGLANVDRVARRDPKLRTLRQALGYCWSVAVAALPQVGLPVFAALEDSDDPDIAWIVRENRRKSRLQRILNGGSRR